MADAMLGVIVRGRKIPGGLTRILAISNMLPATPLLRRKDQRVRFWKTAWISALVTRTTPDVPDILRKNSKVFGQPPERGFILIVTRQLASRPRTDAVNL